MARNALYVALVALVPAVFADVVEFQMCFLGKVMPAKVACDGLTCTPACKQIVNETVIPSLDGSCCHHIGESHEQTLLCENLVRNFSRNLFRKMNKCPSGDTPIDLELDEVLSHIEFSKREFSLAATMTFACASAVAGAAISALIVWRATRRSNVISPLLLG